jgi:hypothetical protein
VEGSGEKILRTEVVREKEERGMRGKEGSEKREERRRKRDERREDEREGMRGWLEEAGRARGREGGWVGGRRQGG